MTGTMLRYGVDYKTIRRSLDEQGFVEVPLAISETDVRTASSNFLRFLSLPQAIKDSFTKLADPQDRGSHVGYARKSRSLGDSDDKEFFNYRGITELLLNSVIEYNEQDRVVSNFLSSARFLYTSAELALSWVIKAIDIEHPGIYNKIFSKNRGRFTCLRFVRYSNVGDEQYIATPHYDRGSCTLTIAESSPGLRVGKTASTLKLIVKEPYKGIFFPSYTFPRDVGSDVFAPAWHDVVNMENGPGGQRWSMIFFADVDPEGVSYGDTHTVLCN